MSIERRAMLTVDKKFEGGLKLDSGTTVYVEEWPSGWVGHYYPDPAKMSAHSFALDPAEFSVLQRFDTKSELIVAIPEPPPTTEDDAKRQELARRRVASLAVRHEEEAVRLRALLEEMP